MQIQVDIGFEELVKVVKELPPAKLQYLKTEIEKEVSKKKPATHLEELLLAGPVATAKELEVIENNRKAINQWRTS